MTNAELHLKDLWRGLSAEEIEDGCRCLLESTEESGRKPRSLVLEALAKALRFRPSFLQRKPATENLPLLLKRIGAREFERFHDDVIRAWLVHRHRPMLAAFLEASRLPQKNGFVDGEPAEPTAAQFEVGITVLLAKFKPRDAGLYLGYLLLFGGEFWSALSPALSNKQIQIAQLLRPEQSSALPKVAPAPAEPPPETASGQGPEDSDEFTTLDNWLIRTAVACAFGESGALSRDQLEDLVEEVTGLNAQRQQTLFHRGYLHALFDKQLEFHFPGENEERRLWYFTGAVFGLLRSQRHGEVLRLLRDDADLVNQVCENQMVRCGGMLLPQVHPLLWEAKEYGMLQRWLRKQAGRLTPERCAELLLQIHYDASSLVRKGQWAEAEGFLNFLDAFVTEAGRLPDGFPGWFLPANDRKRAQVLQLKGDFIGAEALLTPLSEGAEIEDAGNALCDLALMRAGFRSLVGALPGKDEQVGNSNAEALERGRDLLERAVKAHPTSSTNAHFCLGLMALLGNGDTKPSADHFKSALAGMLKKEEPYSEGGVLQWTRFLLGFALLESAEVADFQYARELIGGSIETPVAFPVWLWSRAMHAAALFDDQSVGQQIAEHLLVKRGAEAFHSIWSSGLAVTVAPLRQTHLNWLDGAELPVSEKWAQLRKLLPAALGARNVGQAEAILDALEGISFQGGRYRREFLELLEADTNYSPAWTIEDAVDSRIKFHELEGNLADAAALLRTKFFAIREAGGWNSIQEAEAILARMEDAGADRTDSAHLRSLIPTGPTEAVVEDSPLKAGTAVYVLYIGGNETQMAYEAEIRSELFRAYPSLKVEFYFPGWDSKWNVHLDRVRPKMFQANAVVLSNMVRTQFGRHVRATCNSSTPWFPCTGKGKQSLKRSIEAAAHWAAKKKST
ncbi:MAG: hypothetical protein RIS76_4262 [Verrucomicrobiota bacterium]|jgi:hypothetical protein